MKGGLPLFRGEAELRGLQFHAVQDLSLWSDLVAETTFS